MTKAEIRKRINELKKEKEKLETEYSNAYNTQYVLKILCNSFFGASSSQYFRYFDVNVAEAITMTGQYLIRNVKKKMNEIGQKNFGKDLTIYQDTDSAYLSGKPFLQKHCEKVGKNINEITQKEGYDFLTDLHNKYLGAKINAINNDLVNYVNTYKKTIKMDQEKICDSSIFIKKKHYILNVIANDGIFLSKPKKTIKGIEIVRSSTPTYIRNQLKDLVDDIFKYKNEKVIKNKLKEYKEDFKNNTIEQIAFPRGIKGMKKYADKKQLYKKGTPIHVRGALLYNNVKNKSKDMDNYPLLHNNEKIKFIYLKTPNPIRENIIAWPAEYDFPFKKLEKYIDWETMWEKVFMPVPEKLSKVIGWDVSPNKGTLVLDI